MKALTCNRILGSVMIKTTARFLVDNRDIADAPTCVRFCNAQSVNSQYTTSEVLHGE